MFTFNQTLDRKLIGLDRLFDTEDWRRHSQEKRSAPLVMREQFMRELSTFNKNVILC